MSQEPENRANLEEVVFVHQGNPVTRRLADHIIDGIVERDTTMDLGSDPESAEAAFYTQLHTLRGTIFDVIEETVTHLPASHSLFFNQDAYEFVDEKLRERLTH